MSEDTFYPKHTSINFTIKNISIQKKRITVFNTPLEYGATKDLLAIPGISESFIRDSLIKGELSHRLNDTKDIVITSSSIDLIQFDSNQHSLLNDLGLSYIDLFGKSFFGYSHVIGPTIFDGVSTFSFATLLSNTYTLTRDIFLNNNSIINSGITIYTAGFRLFCSGKLINNGTIHNNGKNALGATAGAGSALGTTGIGVAGGNGRSNTTGLAGSNQSNTLGDASCAGGAGGAGGINGGGSGGLYNSAIATNGGAHIPLTLHSGVMLGQSSGGNQATISIVGGGAGGGGGGSDNISSTGGGGGGGGGVLILHAIHLVNNGLISANGGNGANASGSAGNAGGGGGGGGGIILNISRYREGDGIIVAYGGSGGLGINSGIAGINGNSGHLDLPTS